MELLELLTHITLGMSIFSKMGTGSQSGKLFFKSLFSGSCVTFTDGPNIITVSNVFYRSPVTQSRVVIGAGDYVTGSYVPSNKLIGLCFDSKGSKYTSRLWANCLGGPGVILNYNSTCIPVFDPDPVTGLVRIGESNNVCENKSLIISGSRHSMVEGVNKAATSSYNMIIGGKSSRLTGSSFSIIVGGYGNYISERRAPGVAERLQHNVSIVGGAKNKISTACCSIILGGYSNCICGQTAGFTINSTLISGKENIISCSGATYSIENVNIVSGQNNFIGQDIKNSIIISSHKSCISPVSDIDLKGMCQHLIIGSYNSCISSFDDKSLYNSIISTSQSKICGNVYYSNVIGGYKNCISTKTNPTYASKFNSIISGVCNCIVKDSSGTSSNFNTIIASYKTTLLDNGSYNKFQMISAIGGSCLGVTGINKNTLKNSSMIGGFENKILSTSNSSEVLSSVVVGGEFNCSAGVILSGSSNFAGKNSIVIGGRENTSYSKIIGGLSNSTTSTTKSIIIGGKNHFTENSDCSFLGFGACNCANSGDNGALIGGYKNLLCLALDSVLIAGCENKMCASNTTKSTFIIGGFDNQFCKSSGNPNEQTYNSGILVGGNNRLTKDFEKIYNTVIVGGFGITSSESNSMVVENIWITGTTSTGSKDHFTQSFTYSLEGISGNFSNPNNIYFLNGLVVGID